ncbi:MAG: hypothetical protein JSW26_13850 [Desulfobacterales bacterium]|nr:MAG: hypothetical protein JSW26_13850 [Desulfobacterales bacterium]
MVDSIALTKRSRCARAPAAPALAPRVNQYLIKIDRIPYSMFDVHSFFLSIKPAAPRPAAPLRALRSLKGEEGTPET